MTKAFDVLIERDLDGYYVASVPALPGCHTQARSLDALMKRVREAIELCLEVEAQPLDGASLLVCNEFGLRHEQVAQSYGQPAYCGIAKGGI